MIKENGNLIKKALVTGGAGFIGSHLCGFLAGMGVEVISLDNYSAGKIENLSGIDCEKIEGDILDQSLVRRLMEGVDVVFHNAASKKTVCMADPKKDLDVNGKGTLVLLTAALECGVKKFIHASTGSVYGHPRRFPLGEDHPLIPTSYYGVSKLAGERYVQMFHDVYGLNTTILRYFHVYGPRQASGQYGGVVAIFIDSMLKGSPICIHGDGSQERSFTFVRDVVNANFVAAFSPLSNGRIYNCASGLKIRVIDLFDTLAGLLKYDRSPEHIEADLGEVYEFNISNDRARKDLMVDFTQFDEGLRETIIYFLGESKDNGSIHVPGI